MWPFCPSSISSRVSRTSLVLQRRPRKAVGGPHRMCTDSFDQNSNERPPATLHFISLVATAAALKAATRTRRVPRAIAAFVRDVVACRARPAHVEAALQVTDAD